MNKCGTYEHFTDAGDWNLCCNIPHPTPKEKEMGLEFYFGHICYIVETWRVLPTNNN